MTSIKYRAFSNLETRIANYKQYPNWSG